MHTAPSRADHLSPPTPSVLNGQSLPKGYSYSVPWALSSTAIPTNVGCMTNPVRTLPLRSRLPHEPDGRRSLGLGPVSEISHGILPLSRHIQHTHSHTNKPLSRQPLSPPSTGSFLWPDTVIPPSMSRRLPQYTYLSASFVTTS
jgi:hypothetical protein